MNKYSKKKWNMPFVSWIQNTGRANVKALLWKLREVLGTTSLAPLTKALYHLMEKPIILLDDIHAHKQQDEKSSLTDRVKMMPKKITNKKKSSKNRPKTVKSAKSNESTKKKHIKNSKQEKKFQILFGSESPVPESYSPTFPVSLVESPALPSMPVINSPLNVSVSKTDTMTLKLEDFYEKTKGALYLTSTIIFDSDEEDTLFLKSEFNPLMESNNKNKGIPIDKTNFIINKKNEIDKVNHTDETEPEFVSDKDINDNRVNHINKDKNKTSKTLITTEYASKENNNNNINETSNKEIQPEINYNISKKYVNDHFMNSPPENLPQNSSSDKGTTVFDSVNSANNTSIQENIQNSSFGFESKKEEYVKFPRKKYNNLRKPYQVIPGGKMASMVKSSKIDSPTKQISELVQQDASLSSPYNNTPKNFMQNENNSSISSNNFNCTKIPPILQTNSHAPKQYSEHMVMLLSSLQSLVNAYETFYKDVNLINNISSKQAAESKLFESRRTIYNKCQGIFSNKFVENLCNLQFYNQVCELTEKHYRKNFGEAYQKRIFKYVISDLYHNYVLFRQASQNHTPPYQVQVQPKELFNPQPHTDSAQMPLNTPVQKTLLSESASFNTPILKKSLSTPPLYKSNANGQVSWQSSSVASSIIYTRNTATRPDQPKTSPVFYSNNTALKAQVQFPMAQIYQYNTPPLPDLPVNSTKLNLSYTKPDLTPITSPKKIINNSSPPIFPLPSLKVYPNSTNPIDNLKDFYSKFCCVCNTKQMLNQPCNHTLSSVCSEMHMRHRQRNNNPYNIQINQNMNLSNEKTETQRQSYLNVIKKNIELDQTIASQQVSRSVSLQDQTRSSISRDSGIMSPPLEFFIDHKTLPEPDSESGSSFAPYITHVTSLNPNAKRTNVHGKCEVCHENTLLKCMGCFLVYYCSRKCQEDQWNYHEPICKKLQLVP